LASLSLVPLGPSDHQEWQTHRGKLQSVLAPRSNAERLGAGW